MKRNFIIKELLISPSEKTQFEKKSARIVNEHRWLSLPINVYADLAFNAMYISQLQEAINVWNSTRLGNLLNYVGTRNNIQEVLNAIGVTKAPIANSGTCARTITYYEGTTYSKSIVTLNSNLTFNNGSKSRGMFYLKSILIHELGHSLGLLDNDDLSSIMYRYYTGGISLSSKDINIIDSVY